jgi:IS1 family transposase
MLAQKNAVWIWIAVDRYAKEFISFTIGDRSTKTGEKLWKGIKDRAKGFVATDYWSPYKNLFQRINTSNQRFILIQLKAITVYLDTF